MQIHVRHGLFVSRNLHTFAFAYCSAAVVFWSIIFTCLVSLMNVSNYSVARQKVSANF